MFIYLEIQQFPITTSIPPPYHPHTTLSVLMECGIRWNTIPPFRHSAFLSWHHPFYTTPDKEEEVTSYSSEEDSDAKEECRLTLLHQITGDPRSPPKSQALAMPPPPCKEVVNQETKRDESTAVARNLDL